MPPHKTETLVFVKVWRPGLLLRRFIFRFQTITYRRAPRTAWTRARVGLWAGLIPAGGPTGHSAGGGTRPNSCASPSMILYICAKCQPPT